MKTNFKWTSYSETITKDDGLLFYMVKGIKNLKEDKELEALGMDEFETCIAENVNAQELFFGDYKVLEGQLEVMKSCGQLSDFYNIFVDNIFTNGFVHFYYYVSELHQNMLQLVNPFIKSVFML